MKRSHMLYAMFGQHFEREKSAADPKSEYALNWNVNNTALLDDYTVWSPHPHLILKD